jgi:hypothetical protein
MVYQTAVFWWVHQRLLKWGLRYTTGVMMLLLCSKSVWLSIGGLMLIIAQIVASTFPDTNACVMVRLFRYI